MTDTLTRLLCLAAAIGAGLAGGVFFAFSTFVMAGLAKASDRAGLESMQGINKAAPAPAFMILLLGTAVLCLVLGISAVLRLGEPGAVWQLIGCAAYLVTIVVTVVYHVPRNDALARLDPSAVGSAQAWRDYLSAWTAWNHLRTASGAAAAVFLTIGYRLT